MKRVKVWKRLLALILTFCMIVPMTFQGERTVKAAGYSYNVSAAIAYAEAHWNDGVGLCAEFVSKCVRAGGISIPVKTLTNQVYDSVSSVTGVQGQWLTLTSGGYALYSQNSDKLAKGDIVISWCEGHGHLYRPHIMLCGGYDSAGYATFYAHNNARHNARIPASSGKCGVCGRSNGQLRAKVLHLSGGYSPEGCLDQVTAGDGTVTVKGWAFDRDLLGSQLRIDIYAGTTFIGSCQANTKRMDVNSAYPGVGDYHGFEATFNTDLTGNQSIYVYAINVGEGDNTRLGIWDTNIKPKAGTQSVANGDYYIASAIDNNYYATTANNDKLSNVYLSKTKKKFTFTYLGNGYYKIMADGTNGLDVWGAGTQNTANILLYPYASDDLATHWVVKKESDGNYSIIARCNGLYMEAYGAKAYEGCNIDTYQREDSPHMRWKLIPAKVLVTSVELDKTELTMEPDEIYTPKVTLYPADATNKSIQWNSSDTSVVSVSSKGVIKAKKVGTAKIVATAIGGVSTPGSNTVGIIQITVKEKECKHTYTEIEDASKASCTKEGYTGDTYCLDCGARLQTGSVIPKTWHHESGWITDTYPTEEETGSRHVECTVCGKVLQTETIPKIVVTTETPTTETPTTGTTTGTTTEKPTTGTTTTTVPDVSVGYRTHVQSLGWLSYVADGALSGTIGKSKRMEAIKIAVYGNSKLGITYTTHCQSYGWLPWVSNGKLSGTSGESKRLEAIKIKLTGADADKYDVYYRVHAQSYGWLGWAKNGEAAGTSGLSKRLESIQIAVVKKGEAVPGDNYGGVNAAATTHQSQAYVTSNSGSSATGTQTTNTQATGTTTVTTTAGVAYKTHVQTFGWQGWKYNGTLSGTTGLAKRLEGINIKLTNQDYSGDIIYTTHVQTYGWQNNENDQRTWRRNGEMSGTSGQAKRLEAIRIALTGEMAKHYDIYYRVHAQNYGWLSWAKNGAPAGTAGCAMRLEGIQIVLVPKGNSGPAGNYGGIKSVRRETYISQLHVAKTKIVVS